MADVAVLLSIGRHPASGRARRADRDARALEMALGQRDDARVHAIHAGEPAEPALRDYLGMGLERLTVLAGAHADAESALVEYLRRLRPGVTLAGASSECGEASGMLPYRVAEALGAQLVANAVSFTLRGDTALVIQALPRGNRKALRVTLPVVLTVDRAAAEARMSAFAAARRGTIVEIAAAAAGPAPAADWTERPARARPRRLRTLGQGAAAERLRGISSVRAGTGNRLQGLDPQQAASAIWRYLLQEALVSAPAQDAAQDAPPAPDARGTESA